MLKIGQNWGKIANYPPQCSTKIGTSGYKRLNLTASKRHRVPLLASILSSCNIELSDCPKFFQLPAQRAIILSILGTIAILLEKILKNRYTLTFLISSTEFSFLFFIKIYFL